MASCALVSVKAPPHGASARPAAFDDVDVAPDVGDALSRAKTNRKPSAATS